MKDPAAVDSDPRFVCISTLSQAMHNTMSKYTEAVLDVTVAGGLIPPLEEALRGMAHHIPSIRSAIQE